MRRIVSALLLVSFLCALPQGPVRAADGEGADEGFLDHLTEEEKAYVAAMDAAFESALLAVESVPEMRDFDATPFGFDEAELAVAWMDAVKAASPKCTAAAAALRRAPPAPLSEAAEAASLVADMLDGAFSSCMPLLKGEARRGLADTLGNALLWPFGPAGSTGRNRPSELAKAVACVQQERAELLTIVEGGAVGFYEVVGEVAQKRIEEEEAEEAMWNFLFDDCFIATAAYGTGTAAEIDVLRSFRDGVLLMSPAGRDLIGFYYAASPPVAAFIARHENVRTFVRECIVDPIVRLVSWVEPLWQPA